jgi:GT2 family glycosyltransferase
MTVAAEGDERIGVVLITHNGGARIGRALRELEALPERPAIVVVDNASSDGTVERLRREHPRVLVVLLADNRGAAGRTAGVVALDRPYAAFAEDDSWNEPGALRAAADLLDAHPRVAVVNAHTLVGADGHADPLHEDMVGTGVRDGGQLPGHPLLSFLEGVSIVRSRAYLGVGGFDPRLGIGGPEEHLAADLLERGWALRYVPWVRARHTPDHRSPSPRLRRLGLRNTLWFAWTRRPWRPALRWTAHVIAASPPDRATLAGLAGALAALPHALRERRPLPAAIEAQMAVLDEQKRRSRARSYGRTPRRA